jgi:predicted DNA-binding transcriptional regulator AlpA
MSDKQPERLLTEKEAAAHLKVSRSFLAKARMKGNGPAFVRIGEKAIRYKMAALVLYEKANTHTSTSEY